MNTPSKNISDRVCHVAYTLNNAQPVISTIIGSQPLFYMDTDIIYEEEQSALDEILETRIDMFDLEDDTTVLQRFSEQFERASEEYFETFSDNKKSFSVAAEYTPNLEEIKNVIYKSRLAKSLYDDAINDGVDIKFTSQTQTSEYSEQSKKIMINAALSFEEQVLACVKELRRHGYSKTIDTVNLFDYDADQALFLNRLLEADMCVAIIRSAWEMQLAGVKNIWERIENSSMADMGRAFAAEAFRDFRTLNNGEASVAVFETWFLSELSRYSDKSVIKDMLAHNDRYLADLDKIQKKVTTLTIGALGEMPFGNNYLAKYAPTIVSDPLFYEVRDRSNANFLWFIKFERTYKEKEQELQEEGILRNSSDGEVLSSSSSKINSDISDNDGTSANIISFADHDAEKSMSRLSSKNFKRSKEKRAAILTFNQPSVDA